jgi:hypothetical protein
VKNSKVIQLRVVDPLDRGLINCGGPNLQELCQDFLVSMLEVRVD